MLGGIPIVGVSVLVIGMLGIIIPVNADTDYEFTVINGKDILSNPAAQDILEKIELSKKILAELEKGIVAPVITEKQKFVEEQRKIAEASLQRDLDRMNKKYEDHTPRNAFASYVAGKPEFMQDFYWDQFNYLDEKVSKARQQRDQIIQDGGNYFEAQKAFVNIANFPKSEVVSVFNELVDKHDLYDHYAGDLDPDGWYPEEAVELFDSWKKEDRIVSVSTKSPARNIIETQNIDIPTIKTSNQLMDHKISFEQTIHPIQNKPVVVQSTQAPQTVSKLEDNREGAIRLGGTTFDEVDGKMLNGAREFIASAWIKPDYDRGSPTFTILGKPGVFELTINNYVEPRHVVEFALFDGIKWNTIKSYSKINEEWTHVAGILKDSTLSLYVNGKLEAMYKIGGVLSLNSKGAIEMTPVQVKDSSEDIYIGVQKIVKLDEQKTFNFFSGMIDDVLVDDEALKIDEVYQDKNF